MDKDVWGGEKTKACVNRREGKKTHDVISSEDKKNKSTYGLSFIVAHFCSISGAITDVVVFVSATRTDLS